MSRRRFRPTDAFVDESIRGRRYLMGCVFIEARDLPTARRAVLDLVVGGSVCTFTRNLTRPEGLRSTYLLTCRSRFTSSARFPGMV